eukprot:TRINITY_DN4207_c0_g1_i1.p1 TRINITY_DN4207_c0_g1~~TRINITY_DN4207_c0_g1_i1.p1  ORF type:complete len:150 (-),score=16.35 TRINITY_DN4207_c0_g1_i1:18-401(-)
MANQEQTKLQQINYLINKVKLGGETEWEADEVLDVLHWSRQILALISGLICGFMGITNVLGFVIFVILTLGSTILLYRLHLKIDEEEIGSGGELFIEGMMSAFAIFLLTWISLYTLQNPDQLQQQEG